MPSRVTAFSLILVSGIAAVSGADETPLSSPSRVVLFQRDVLAVRAVAPVEDPMAAVRRALFKRTEPGIMPPPTAIEIAPAIAVVPPPPSAPARAPALPKPVSPLPSVPPVGIDAVAVRELALQPAAFTPYDRYLGAVRTVIDKTSDRGNSVAAACTFLREARSFRYATRDPYRADPPAVTAARREGDCKSKALWLYDRLSDPTALFVIGKVVKGAKSSHAWLYWRHESRWWILDPTNRSAPIAADSVSRDRYVPYYSFGKGGTYRHAATQLLLASDNIIARTPAVAHAPVSSAQSAKKKKRG